MLEVHASITELDELRGLSRGDCIGRSAEALGGPPEKRKVAERLRGGRAEPQACVMAQCQRLVLEASFDTSGYGPCVGLTVAARQGLLRRRERAPGCGGPELRRAGDPAFRIPVRDREGRARNFPCATARDALEIQNTHVTLAKRQTRDMPSPRQRNNGCCRMDSRISSAARTRAAASTVTRRRR